VPLVPLSSVAAVVRKSAGAALAQDRTVAEGTSGEASSAASSTVRPSTTSEAMVPSLMMS
jgi:hypothetical protein